VHRVFSRFVVAVFAHAVVQYMSGLCELTPLSPTLCQSGDVPPQSAEPGEASSRRTPLLKGRWDSL